MYTVFIATNIRRRNYRYRSDKHYDNNVERRFNDSDFRPDRSTTNRRHRAASPQDYDRQIEMSAQRNSRDHRHDRFMDDDRNQNKHTEWSKSNFQINNRRNNQHRSSRSPHHHDRHQSKQYSRFVETSSHKSRSPAIPRSPRRYRTSSPHSHRSDIPLHHRATAHRFGSPLRQKSPSPQPYRRNISRHRTPRAEWTKSQPRRGSRSPRSNRTETLLHHCSRSPQHYRFGSPLRHRSRSVQRHRFGSPLHHMTGTAPRHRSPFPQLPLGKNSSPLQPHRSPPPIHHSSPPHQHFRNQHHRSTSPLLMEDHGHRSHSPEHLRTQRQSSSNAQYLRTERHRFPSPQHQSYQYHKSPSSELLEPPRHLSPLPEHHRSLSPRQHKYPSPEHYNTTLAQHQSQRSQSPCQFHQEYRSRSPYQFNNSRSPLRYRSPSPIPPPPKMYNADCPSPHKFNDVSTQKSYFSSTSEDRSGVMGRNTALSRYFNARSAQRNVAQSAWQERPMSTADHNKFLPDDLYLQQEFAQQERSTSPSPNIDFMPDESDDQNACSPSTEYNEFQNNPSFDVDSDNMRSGSSDDEDDNLVGSSHISDEKSKFRIAYNSIRRPPGFQEAIFIERRLRLLIGRKKGFDEVTRNKRIFHDYGIRSKLSPQLLSEIIELTSDIELNYNERISAEKEEDVLPHIEVRVRQMKQFIKQYQTGNCDGVIRFLQNIRYFYKSDDVVQEFLFAMGPKLMHHVMAMNLEIAIITAMQKLPTLVQPQSKLSNAIKLEYKIILKYLLESQSSKNYM